MKEEAMDIKYNVYMSSLRLFDNFAWHKRKQL